MKYGNDNVVDAIYSGEKKGNPFLEAMPEMMSTQEVIRRLASFPVQPEDAKNLSDGVRVKFCVISFLVARNIRGFA